MAYLTLKDGCRYYYKDWGKGQPVVFSHGWPLSSDAWENQMFFLAQKGYRTIAPDRRGHGRSDQTWEGNNMDTYADDLAQLIEHLDLHDAVLVGHSTGGGEAVRYLTRHGSARVAKLVLVSAVPPLMVKTEDNPDGIPLEVFDNFRKNVLEDRAQFFMDVPSGPFYNKKASDGLIRAWWQQGMLAGFKNVYDCIKAFSETDFREELQRIEVPTLVVHGDNDQVVPLEISGKKSAALIPNATLKVYVGASHGIPDLDKEQLNADLLSFISEGRVSDD